MGPIDIVDLGPLGWLVALSIAALVLLVVVAIVVRRSMGGMGSDIGTIRENLREKRWSGDRRRETGDANPDSPDRDH